MLIYKAITYILEQNTSNSCLLSISRASEGRICPLGFLQAALTHFHNAHMQKRER